MDTNPTNPPVRVMIDDIVYSLVFNLDSVALAEELTNRPLLLGLQERDANSPTISLVRAMFYACVHTHHPEIQYDTEATPVATVSAGPVPVPPPTVKSMITRKNIRGVWDKVIKAWLDGLAEPDKDAGAPAPPKGQS